MDSFFQVWGLILDYCKDKITEVAYKTWIAKISPRELDFDNGVAVLVTPNDFYQKTIDKCYKPLLVKAFEEVFGSVFDLDIVTQKQEKTPNAISNNFTSEFSFENYIVGPSNKFAHAAALAVAANPSHAYNPLFIYGNSGLGKTHLLYAIRNDVEKNRSNFTVIYIKGDEFTNELIDAIRRNSTIDFHLKYRKADILLVDDIQFIAGKNATQEEFFHTFNSLYEANKQIVLTSDRPPKEIRTLEERLRTRFEWGLIADIQPPDFETRIALIKRKAENLKLKLPNEVCDFIAKKLKSNIRQLEGAVKKIKAYIILNNAKPTIQVAQTAIADVLNNDSPPLVTIDRIINETARTFSIDPKDLRSAKRSARISKARKIAIHVTRLITQLPLAEIGKQFGGRDHSTIVYSLTQTEGALACDPQKREIVEDIIKNVRMV
ncbi:MAG: chromosomal replication initiator protein DnaA [Oscillospiraceae bacterium]|jgi:chromosomal replication initiator protein|nr:chromosomal replication initiator protein DnaA [Oscillospiraceae bacterium]